MMSQLSDIDENIAVDAIFRHPLYQEKYKALVLAERDRIFCRHDINHFLDVARLMWIYTLRDGKDCISREMVYAAALLHDLGRIDQIRSGIPHHEAGAEIAAVILGDLGYDRDFTDRICYAISNHRKEPDDSGCDPDADYLSEILYTADKRSRKCFDCAAIKECNWSDEKKNLKIVL